MAGFGLHYSTRLLVPPNYFLIKNAVLSLKSRQAKFSPDEKRYLTSSEILDKLQQKFRRLLIV